MEGVCIQCSRRLGCEGSITAGSVTRLQLAIASCVEARGGFDLYPGGDPLLVLQRLEKLLSNNIRMNELTSIALSDTPAVFQWLQTVHDRGAEYVRTLGVK